VTRDGKRACAGIGVGAGHISPGQGSRSDRALPAVLDGPATGLGLLVANEYIARLVADVYQPNHRGSSAVRAGEGRFSTAERAVTQTELVRASRASRTRATGTYLCPPNLLSDRADLGPHPAGPHLYRHRGAI
jgi:hypothetical protein